MMSKAAQLETYKIAPNQLQNGFTIGPIKLNSWHIHFYLNVIPNWASGCIQLQILECQYFPCPDCNTDTSYKEIKGFGICKCKKLKQVIRKIKTIVKDSNDLDVILDYIKQHYNIKVITE